jgi:hypothetical protein
MIKELRIFFDEAANAVTAGRKRKTICSILVDNYILEQA